MFKTILAVLLLVSSIAFAQDDKNAKSYVNDCDSYGQLAYTTTYLREHPVTFEDGVKRLMLKAEFGARLTKYLTNSNLPDTEVARLMKDMMEVWDTEMDGDPVDIYTTYVNKCIKRENAPNK